MPGAIDVLDPERPKRVVIVASNPAVSEKTGWPIGFGGRSSATPNSGTAAARLMIEALGT